MKDANHLAIAYAIKRRGKKLAQGGEVKSRDDIPEPNKKNAADFQRGFNSGGPSAKQAWANLKEGLGMAKGGEVNEDDAHGLIHPHSLALKIMAKKMADGGEVKSPGLSAFHKGFNKSLDEGIVAKFKRNVMGKDEEPKKMAHGGEVEDDESAEHEMSESIDNEDFENHPDNDFLSAEEQTPYFNKNQADLEDEEPLMKRKKMIGSIMRGLHSKG